MAFSECDVEMDGSMIPVYNFIKFSIMLSYVYDDEIILYMFILS